MTEGKKSLDWAGALDQLERIRESLERAETAAPDRALGIFQERARRLALPEQAAQQLAAGMLIVFRLSGERFAFAVSDVSEILPEFKLTPVPGAPPSVAGVINVRGEIRPVFRLEPQLGLPEAGNGPGGAILLMQVDDRRFGVQTEAVEEIRAVPNDDSKLPGDGAHVEWMTEDLVRVLNTMSLWKKES